MGKTIRFGSEVSEGAYWIRRKQRMDEMDHLDSFEPDFHDEPKYRVKKQKGKTTREYFNE